MNSLEKITGQHAVTDAPLTIAGKSYNSRLIIGTGKYKSYAENAAALEASGAEIVTVAKANSDEENRESFKALKKAWGFGR